MAFNYECEFNLQAQRLTPITKRQDVRLGILQSISAPIQSARDNFFDGFLEGDSAAAWDVATAYVRYDRVNYQNRIYECTNDITGGLPTDTDYWVQVVADFRGAVERIKYNCQTIMLEYILNKWFGTTFRQPSTGLNSDFYIVNLDRDGPTFSATLDSIVDDLFIASEVPEITEFSEDFVGEAPDYTTGINFTVFYPAATITSTTDGKYFQMTALINKYKLIGTTVNYTSY